METFVLASGSPRRRELLERLQVKFRVQEAGIVESFVEGAAPDRVVMELSWRKADAVAKNIGDRAVVLGADTVVAVENKILGKPSNGEEALSMLKALRGRIHHVYTGITLCFPVNTTYIQAYERTEVSMAMVSFWNGTWRLASRWTRQGHMEFKERVRFWSIESRGTIGMWWGFPYISWNRPFRAQDAVYAGTWGPEGLCTFVHPGEAKGHS